MSSNLQFMPDAQQIRQDLLDVEEVAKRLKVSPQWVRDHATRRHPKLPCVRLGSLIRFQPRAVDEFIEQQAQAAPWRRRRAKAS
jgi:excisionase family DNA binding protein